MTVRRFLLAALLSSAVPSLAAAQDVPRFIAGGSLGLASTWGDESRLGEGFPTEGRLGVNVTRKTQIDFVLARIPFERSFESGVRTDGRSVFTGLTLKHDFTSGTARPFVLVGYGLNHSRSHRVDPFLDRTNISTDHGYVVGTGLVFVRDKWEIGPEARVYMFAIEADSSVARILSGGIRAGVRF
jgi:hypothetical protein